MAWYHRNNTPRPVPPVPVDPLDKIAATKAEIAMAKAAVARGHKVYVPPNEARFTVNTLPEALAMEAKYTSREYRVFIEGWGEFTSSWYYVTVSWDDEQ